jgi:hypothetical protein
VKIVLSWTASPHDEIKKGMVTLAREFSTRQAARDRSEGAGEQSLRGVMLALGV